MREELCPSLRCPGCCRRLPGQWEKQKAQAWGELKHKHTLHLLHQKPAEILAAQAALLLMMRGPLPRTHFRLPVSQNQGTLPRLRWVAGNTWPSLFPSILQPSQGWRCQSLAQPLVLTCGEQLGLPEHCLACGVFVGSGKMASSCLSTLPPRHLFLEL